MKNLIVTTVFSIVSVVAAQALASDIEDYAGLPLYEEGVTTSSEEIIVDESHAGYDGLPVIRWGKLVIQPDMKKAGFSAFDQEGYDGLPLVNTQGRGILPIQD